MNYCNLISRIFHNKEYIIGVCFDSLNSSMIIQNDKNIRWINDEKNLSFENWLTSDESKYKVTFDVPFYGDENENICNMIENIGCYTTYNDYIKLTNDYILEGNQLDFNNINLISNIKIFH